MKKIYLTLLVCFSVSASLFAQTTGDETTKIATFCKVWGFLKYYHPIVASGKFDWDKEFISKIDSLNRLQSKQSISNFYLGWIGSLGETGYCKKCKTQMADSLKFDLNNDWIKDTALFSDELIKQLQHIADNRNTGSNYYVGSVKYIGNTTYNNEKAYKDSIYPSPQLRLLGLARYWNIINYFYPYKYVIGENWDDVLTEMVPKFKDAADTAAYHLAMLELTVKLNDSHAGLSTPYIHRRIGFKGPPFYFKIIDDKAVVTGFFNDSLCEINDIRKGDVFLKVDEVSVKDILSRQSKYIPASNEAVKRRNAVSRIFNGNTDAVNVEFERNGVVASKMLKRYLFTDFNYKWKQPVDTFKILDGNIGYINMGLLVKQQVKYVMKKLEHTKAIIFDVRNYPNGTLYLLAALLNKDRKPFVKFTKPDITYPGVFNWTEPYKCGKKKHKDYYKGKVVLLFDESTQSHAEFTLMALQTAPDVISIGSQTAGADGNVSLIPLPGGYTTYMTGIGVYYPDGRATQRIGIVPDIEVRPTIEGIRRGKDEVLDKAMEILQ